MSNPTLAGLGLLDVPIEVFTAITKQLQFSLYNFVLVSKKCHEVGSPFLFNDKRQNLEFGDEDSDVQHHELYLYLRSLIRGTEEPGRIRKLTVKGSGYEDELSDEWSEIKKDFFAEADRDEINRVVSRIFLEQNTRDAVIQDLESGHWDGAMTLIVSYLWNLEQLEVPSWSGPGPLLAAYITRAGEIQAGEEYRLQESIALPRLKKVVVSHYDTEGAMSSDDIDVWSKISSVKILDAHMVGEDDREEEFDDDDSEILPQIRQRHNIEKIILRYTALSAVALAEFLRQFPGLKHFEYTHADAIVALAPFEPPRIKAALLEVRNTLETLKIEKEENLDGDFTEYPFGSFAEFPRLKHMNFKFSALMGFNSEADDEVVDESRYTRCISLCDTLPPNIEHLELDNCLEDSVKHIIELAQSFDKFPNFKILKLGASADCARLLGEAELGRKCEESGVELKTVAPTVVNDPSGTEEDVSEVADEEDDMDNE